MTVVEGLNQPLALETAVPGETHLVADRTGEIYNYTESSDGIEVIADLSDLLTEITGQAGVQDIALHPDFEDTNRLYAMYSSPSPDQTPDGFSHIH